jgi:hypothetical protein
MAAMITQLGSDRLAVFSLIDFLSLYNIVVVYQHDAGVQWLAEPEVDVALLEARPRLKGCRLGSTRGLE